MPSEPTADGPARPSKKPVIPGWNEEGGGDAPAPRKRPARRTNVDAGRSRNRRRPAPPPTTDAVTESPTDVPFVADDEPVSKAASTASEPTASSGGGFSERVRSAWSGLLARPMLLTGIVVAVPLLALLGDYFLRQRGNAAAVADGEQIDRPDADSVERPSKRTGLVRVYVKDGAGFAVLVNGNSVKDAAGRPLLAPCELEVDARELHRVTVAKEGFRDATKTVSASSGQAAELVFEPIPDPENQFPSLTDAPWFDLEVGQPVALEPVNTPGPEGDPFFTRDGLGLYYTSDGALSGGVLYATRSSPFEPFDEPTSIPLTNDAMSPSVLTLENPETGQIVTHLAFAAKSSVRSAVRENVLDDFTGRDVLRADPDRIHEWTTARLLEGGFALYWTEIENGEPVTYFSARERLTLPFQSKIRVEVPGGVPRLSNDALRQYAYDGKRLQRAVREKVFEWRPGKDQYGRDAMKPYHLPFSDLETVVEIEIPGLDLSDTRRQFCVSEDEQWLVFSDKGAGGDLYVVRLQVGPGWGVVPKGRSIPDKDFSPEIVAAREPEEGMRPFEGVGKPGEDPREKPLPYTEHRREFTELMAAREYAKAVEATRGRIGEPGFEGATEMLEWDLDDVERVRRFWRNAEQGARSMTPGDEFSNGSVDLEFVEFNGGLVVGKLGDKLYPLQLDAMRYGDVVALADLAIEKDDTSAQIDVATFLEYEPSGVERAVDARLKLAGRQGGDFVERIAGRYLGQAKLEFDRDNYLPGLDWIAKLRKFAPASDAAYDADEVEAGLYLKMQWENVGKRQWAGTLSGEYAAGPDREPNSYLLSPKPYSNFELSMEFKVTAENGSGGVYFRYGDPARLRPYEFNAAYKIQVANDFGVEPDPFCTGALFSEQAPKKNLAKPLNQWNTLRMKVVGQKLSVWVNEELVLESNLDNTRIASEGRIALDGITGGVTYRKVLVIELPRTF